MQYVGKTNLLQTNSSLDYSHSISSVLYIWYESNYAMDN